MRVLTHSIILLSVAVVSSAGFARSAGNEKASPTPQPAAEMASLTKALGGKWSTIYKFEPSDMVPGGGNGDGEEVWRSGPGGFTLMEEESIRVGGQEMFILALHWWDQGTNRFRGLLCNNSGRQPAISIPTATVR